MKRLLFITLATFFALSSFAQKKTKLTEEQTDSIIQANKALSMENDSLVKYYTPFRNMADTLSSKYFKKPFSPLAVADPMDSLLNHVALHNANTDSLQAKIEKMESQLKTYTDEEAMKAQITEDLRNAKKLLDEGILTEEEFAAIKKKYIDKL